MRRKEEREEELGIGRSDLDGRTASVQTCRGENGILGGKAGTLLHPYSQIRDDTRKIVTMSYELSLLTLH